MRLQARDNPRDGYAFQTGIYVRAQLPGGRWDNVDLVELTPESQEAWLRDREAQAPGTALQLLLRVLR